MVGAAISTRYMFDLQAGDVFWCTADCGWITGHTYLTYGPLLCGAAIVIYEGVPDHPTPARCWQVVEKYRVRTDRSKHAVVHHLTSSRGPVAVAGVTLQGLLLQKDREVALEAARTFYTTFSWKHESCMNAGGHAFATPFPCVKHREAPVLCLYEKPLQLALCRFANSTQHQRWFVPWRRMMITL